MPWNMELKEIASGRFAPWNFIDDEPVSLPYWEESQLQKIKEAGSFWGWRMAKGQPVFYEKNPGGRPQRLNCKTYEVNTTENGIRLIREYMVKLRGEGVDI